MADSERENILGIIDKRVTQGNTGYPGNFSTDARYLDVNDLRTTLAARNATYYTSTRLNQMTKNDMVYALRTIDDNGGIV